MLALGLAMPMQPSDPDIIEHNGDLRIPLRQKKRIFEAYERLCGWGGLVIMPLEGLFPPL